MADELENQALNIAQDINNMALGLFSSTDSGTVTDLPSSMTKTEGISTALGSAISSAVSGTSEDASSVISQAINDYMQNEEDTSAATGSSFLGYLDKIDTFLENLTGYLDKVFQDVTNLPQYAVDYICETASDWISYWLEWITVRIVNASSASLEGAKYIIANNGTTAALILAIVGTLPGASTLIGVVAAIAAIGAYFKHLYDKYVKPYKQALEFVKEVTEKIISISEKLQKLARYTPPKGGDVNFDKFHIQYSMDATSMIGGAGNIPYPSKPKMKKPPNPFTNTTELINESKNNNTSNS